MKILNCLCAFLLISATAVAQSEMAWQRVSGFPEGEEGIEQGVSACFAGCIGNTIIMAGGCNFPDKPAAEGGAKRYYKGIYAAEVNNKATANKAAANKATANKATANDATASASLHWRRIGSLPTEAAYGVTIQRDNELIFIGGNNAIRGLTSVLRLSLVGDCCNQTVQLDTLPSLPSPMDNMAGAMADSLIVLIGGTNSCSAFILDLRNLNDGWMEIPWIIQQQAVQPVGAAMGNKVCIMGGYTPKGDGNNAAASISRVVVGMTDGMLDNFIDEQADDEPRFVAGAAAVGLSDGSMLVLGGVDEKIFLGALNNPQQDYLQHPKEWYHFNQNAYIWNGTTWKTIGHSPVTARAGAALVNAAGYIYIIGGETKPGVRTHEIYRTIICR